MVCSTPSAAVVAHLEPALLQHVVHHLGLVVPKLRFLDELAQLRQLHAASRSRASARAHAAGRPAPGPPRRRWNSRFARHVSLLPHPGHYRHTDELCTAIAPAPLRLDVQPRLRPRRRRRAAHADRRARVQRRAHARPRRSRPPTSTPRWSSSPSSDCRATRSTTCSTRRRCSTASRRRSTGSRPRAQALRPVIIVGAPRSGCEHGTLQLRGGDPRRPRARGGPQELPARVPRVLRKAPVPRRPRRGRRPGSGLLDRAVPFGADLLFCAARSARVHRCTSRCARTCGCRSRRAPTARSPAPPCWRTCRRATSRSARPASAACCAPSQSARTIAAYVYTAAGMGESTTDLAWDGQALIYENGDLLAEAERFADRRAADLAPTSTSTGSSPTAPAPRATATRSTTTADRLSAMRRIDVRAGRSRRAPVRAAPARRAVPVRSRRPA